MKKATKEDAEILLKLLEITNTPQMGEAMVWFMKEFKAKDYKEFKAKYPPSSPGMRNFNVMLAQYELAGVLVSHGLLNENLYFDISGIEFVWGMIGNIIPGMQKEAGEALWENAVWLAKRQKKWKKDVWKPNLKWK